MCNSFRSVRVENVQLVPISGRPEFWKFFTEKVFWANCVPLSRRKRGTSFPPGERNTIGPKYFFREKLPKLWSPGNRYELHIFNSYRSERVAHFQLVPKWGFTFSNVLSVLMFFQKPIGNVFRRRAFFFSYWVEKLKRGLFISAMIFCSIFLFCSA